MKQADLLLQQREQRAWYQKNLLKDNDYTLVVIKANYPSSDKRNLYTNYLCLKFFFLLKKRFELVDYEVSLTLEGLIFYCLIDDDALIIKKETIVLENSFIGRLVDLDVFTGQQQISRVDLNYSARKCYLCAADAKVCARLQRHSISEIKEYFKKIVIDDVFSNSVFSNLVLFGLINELCKEYSFGTVTINSNGAHKDMDKFTFINSIEAIYEMFNDLEKIDTTDFKQLRTLGYNIEKAMFKRTNNINTYKGAIFSLLLFLAAYKNVKTLNKMSSEIQRLTKNIYNDFKESAYQNNYGVKIYHHYQIAGIRKVAFDGYPLLFNEYLPFYQRTLDNNQTFLLIISSLDDTTIVKRAGYNKLLEIKEYATNIIEDETRYLEFDKYCLNNGISCGGSADLLACVYVCYLISLKE
ncbi:citrate lyase holo-[acyl-carrier protein] synthase [Erysipelotrichaceae bacterium OttesenSCG-928-M19]|nr:citrate lyase holo-[acyl-carrier protein] synthase [Erysipelotrichaceae bacterium OttesenSCG-928-M19]